VEHPVCDVCSRTLLKGEELHEYVSSQGERFGVCVLCRSRAEASGWIPAEQYGTIAQQPQRRARRGLALRRRLADAAARARGRRSARSDPAGPTGPAEDRADEVAATAEPEPQSPSAAEGPAPPVPSEPQQDERPRPPHRQVERSPKPVPGGEGVAPRAPQPRRGPEAIMRGAVESFNSSEESRKIAGLMRSLGEPQAAVLPDPPRQLALVTVAWELSWYQWEVGANGEDQSVREVAKGDEVSELAEEARDWNASVDEDGKLRLRGAGKRRQATASEA
jgi:hypothetical protein